MPDGTRVFVDFVVIATLECLVTEEVDGRVLNAARLLRLCVKVLQAVGLVPPGREDVERDLATN